MMVPVSQRLANRKVKDVFECIRQRGAVSKQELHEISSYTLSTLTRLLDELMKGGLIEETGFGESTGGRRPTLYRVRADYAYVIGLDVSRAVSRIVLCDMHLNKLDGVVWPMTPQTTPERLIDDATDAVNRMLDRRNIPRDRVLGIGIGAVGPLSRERGILLDPKGFSTPGWSQLPIVELLEHRLRLPAYLDNGANTALLGEYWSEMEHRSKHLLYVHVGVGIRSSVMTGGKLVYGAVDMEGAAGQMIIESDGVSPIDGRGNYGAWESYVTAPALERTAVSRLKQGRKSVLLERVRDIEKVRYTDLEQAYMDGDPLVKEIFSQAAAYFGIGLANLLNILHPETVIIGGPIAGNIDVFFEDAVRIALSNTYYYPEYQVKFKKSKLHDDAVAVGAAALVIQQLTV
jgi:predicted NBD/HSP70 family sugar kinase